MATLDRFDFEDIEGLRVGRTDRVNTACIVYRIEDTIIDTGPANQWRFVKRFLEERDVAQVAITHHHEDHGGNGARIKECYNPRIFAHEAGHQFLEKGYDVPLYRRITWGKPKTFKAEALPPQVNAGKLRLQPLHAPGHAPDQVVYYERNRGWLFSGDMYITGKPRMLRADEDPNQEIESLTFVLQHHFDTLFCSHRGVILNGYEVLRDKLKYLISMREQVRHYMKTGDSTKEIARRILGKEEFVYWLSRGEFSKRNYIEGFARQMRMEHNQRVGQDYFDEEDEA